MKPNAEIGFLISYDTSNIYRVWILTQNWVIHTRDITFNEYSFYSEYTPLMTKEPVIPIAELPYPREVTEDSDEDENDWVPRLSQAFHRSSQDQKVDRYTQRVEST